MIPINGETIQDYDREAVDLIPGAKTVLEAITPIEVPVSVPVEVIRDLGTVTLVIPG